MRMEISAAILSASANCGESSPYLRSMRAARSDATACSARSFSSLASLSDLLIANDLQGCPAPLGRCRRLGRLFPGGAPPFGFGRRHQAAGVGQKIAKLVFRDPIEPHQHGRKTPVMIVVEETF